MPVVGRLCTVREECARTRGVAPADVDVLLVGRIAELGEPEAVLFHEIDREAVAAGRDRATERELLPHRLSRRDAALERGAGAVPDDRVAPLVEPVVGEEEAVLGAARSPRRGACVLHLDSHLLQDAGRDRCALERAPARDEWAGGVHSGASLGR